MTLSHPAPPQEISRERWAETLDQDTLVESIDHLLAAHAALWRKRHRSKGKRAA